MRPRAPSTGPLCLPAGSASRDVYTDRSREAAPVLERSDGSPLRPHRTPPCPGQDRVDRALHRTLPYVTHTVSSPREGHGKYCPPCPRVRSALPDGGAWASEGQGSALSCTVLEAVNPVLCRPLSRGARACGVGCGANGAFRTGLPWVFGQGLARCTLSYGKILVGLCSLVNLIPLMKSFFLDSVAPSSVSTSVARRDSVIILALNAL